MQPMSLEQLFATQNITPLMSSRQDTGSLTEIISAVSKLGFKNQSEACDESMEKLDPAASSHGRVFAYIDSQISFFFSIFTCLIRAVANFVTALLFSVTMFCESGYNFCITHFYRTAIDLNCARIAVIGAILPIEGAESFKALQAGLNDFVRP